MSTEKVIGSIVFAVKYLKTAEDNITPETEYLREEIKGLLESSYTLLDKIGTEQALLETQGVLHGGHGQLDPDSTSDTAAPPPGESTEGEG